MHGTNVKIIIKPCVTSLLATEKRAMVALGITSGK
jgi:hypothetical protein